MVMPRKDREIHDIQGTRPHYKDQQQKSDSKVSGSRLKMPADYPPEKVTVWKMLFGPLMKRKTLTKGDSAAAVIIVEMWLRWQKLAQMAAETPITEVSWVDKNGDEHTKIVEHPASKMATSLEHKLLLALKEFSATPASREKAKPTKTALKPEKEPTAREKYLAESARLQAEIEAEKQHEAALATKHQSDEDLLNSINLENLEVKL